MADTGIVNDGVEPAEAVDLPGDDCASIIPSPVEKPVMTMRDIPSADLERTPDYGGARAGALAIALGEVRGFAPARQSCPGRHEARCSQAEGFGCVYGGSG